MPIVSSSFAAHAPMMSELIPEPPRPGLDLSERFFREARMVLLDRNFKFEFAVEDILEIVRDPALRGDFERRFRDEINDPKLKRLILRFLQEVAITQEEATDRAERGASTIDNASVRFAAPLVVAGAAAIVATTASIASIIFLGFGLIGAASLGAASLIAGRNASKAKFSAIRLRELIKHLEEKNESDIQ